MGTDHLRLAQADSDPVARLAAAPPLHLFWEYDEQVRLDPPLQVAAAKVTEFGSIHHVRWLIQRFGIDAIKQWLLTSRVVSGDRKSVNLMCVMTGIKLDQVRLSPVWTQ